MYTGEYDSSALRSPLADLPYTMAAIIEQYCTGKELLLDMGCGTCRKILHLAKHCKLIVGVDVSAAMISKAQTRVHDHPNVHLYQMNSTYTAFPNQHFDIVTCMLSSFYPAEVYRVLKPGGRFFWECLGADDKREFKAYFGKDGAGWRGILQEENNSSRMANIRMMLEGLFADVQLTEYRWMTNLSYEGLRLLLQLTSTVRGAEANMEELDRAFNELADEKGFVAIHEHRYVISGVARIVDCAR